MIKRGLLLVTLLAIVLSVQGIDNDQRYEKSMKAAIDELYTAQDIEALTTAVNKFERIASAEEGKWRPFYYASYGSLMKAIYSMNSDKAAMDPFLDEAQSYLDKSEAVETNVETVLLQGYIHMIRLTVDPASRGQQYSGESMQKFGQALSMDPDNPRALMLMGQMKMGTAQFFGQDGSEGCEMIANSVSYFDNYEPKNALDPTWGKEFAQSAAEGCK